MDLACSLEFLLCECEMASRQHPLTLRGASGPLSNENVLKKQPSAAPTLGTSLSLNAASNRTDSPASTDSAAPLIAPFTLLGACEQPGGRGHQRW